MLRRRARIRTAFVLALFGSIVLPAGVAFAADGPVPVRVENGLAGTPGWTLPPASPQIEGYASEVSAQPGDALHFHVSARPAARYRVEVYRLGWYGGVGARLVACLPGCDRDEAASPQALPQPDSLTGLVRAGWPIADTLAVPSGWTSGYYQVRFVLTSGPAAGSAATTYVIVRDPPGSRSAILVQVPVNTWQAYNEWGGKSLYNFSSSQSVPASRVSFDRPYHWGGLASQGPLQWELPVVRFLEREGYDVSYQTDLDTSADPSSLLLHRLVISVGHGEYWTKEERDAFERARDSSVNLAFLGANTGYWQVRYGDGGRTLVGYKSAGDPIADPALKTVLFRSLSPARPECALLGVQHQGGSLRWARSDYLVADASDPWFRDTGLSNGARLADLVSVEADTIPANQPPGYSCGHPVTVLFHHDGGGEYLGNADAVRYLAPSGALVFASGSLQFGWGLDTSGLSAFGHTAPAEPGLQQFMRNALTDLTRPVPPPPLTATPEGSQLANSGHPGARSAPPQSKHHAAGAPQPNAQLQPAPTRAHTPSLG